MAVLCLPYIVAGASDHRLMLSIVSLRALAPPPARLPHCLSHRQVGRQIGVTGGVTGVVTGGLTDIDCHRPTNHGQVIGVKFMLTHRNIKSGKYDQPETCSALF